MIALATRGSPAPRTPDERFRPKTERSGQRHEGRQTPGSAEAATCIGGAPILHTGASALHPAMSEAGALSIPAGSSSSPALVRRPVTVESSWIRKCPDPPATGRSPGSGEMRDGRRLRCRDLPSCRHVYAEILTGAYRKGTLRTPMIRRSSYSPCSSSRGERGAENVSCQPAKQA